VSNDGNVSEVLLHKYDPLFCGNLPKNKTFYQQKRLKYGAKFADNVLMMNILLGLLLIFSFGCSSLKKAGSRTIAEEGPSDSSSQELAPSLSFTPNSPLTNGNSGVLVLKVSPQTDLEESDLEGEVTLKQVDGETKTILFPFYLQAPGQFRAVIGFPYKTIPGKQEIKVLVKGPADNEELTHRFELKKGVYGKDKPLSVDPNTVRPDEKTQLIIDEQQKILDEIYSTSFNKKLWKPNFKIPVATPVITSNYGNARTYNGSLSSFHSGMDYRGNEQTALMASNDGVVRLNQHLHFTGNTVIIDHGKGVFTLYGHMSSFAKNLKPGEFVKKGQYIGQAGRTGRVTGPHLHFGFKIHNELVNPTFLYTLE
jgi:murein DD-endopeptidase MepM/ murein hydrolase activator NlpD